ncbi:MAG: choice-of-anchor D domain-containing protein, partial [Ktedonobacteraceae bacterium]|nr:choice-of-anchor D domain-containing protein [Ktedonobacteraceae bacterium]
TSIDFSNQIVNATSAAQTVTLTNSGTASLNTADITLAGTNASDFAQTNNCPKKLAENASCTISVTFTPTATGACTGMLTFTDDATDSPQSLVLSGTGVTPTVYFNDDFESGNLNAWTLPNSDSTGTATVQSSIVNNGQNALDLSNSSGQYVYENTALPAGPQAQTYTRFYFRYSSNVSAGTPLAIVRNANGSNVWEADLDMNHHGLDIYFWNGANTISTVASSANVLSPDTWYSVEIQDTQTSNGHGEVWLNGNSIGSVNGDLSMSDPYASLMLYSSAAGDIYFDDVRVANVYNGTIAPSPTVSLNPGSVNFGNQGVNTTGAAQKVTLTNSGQATLNISNIALSGTNAGDFAQTNNCGSTLAAGASCTINITFTPGAAGTRSAGLIVTDNASNSPQTLALTGTGVILAPSVTLNPGSVSFGNQNVGTTSVVNKIALTNSGTAALNISKIALSGTNGSDFAQTNNCGSTLAATASCTISVTFTPAAAGNRTANLVLTDNAASSPQTLTLSGIGVVPTMVYLNDGFESGNLNAWTRASGFGAGSATVQSSTVNSGHNALALSNFFWQYSYIAAPLSSGPQTQTYTRFYFRASSIIMGITPIAIAHNARGGNAWEVDLDMFRHGLDIFFWSNGYTVYHVFSPFNSINTNTWYSVEIQDMQVKNGHGEVWLNGSSVGSVNGDLSTAQPYASLMLFNSAFGTLYFDDVRVSNVYNGGTTALKMSQQSTERSHNSFILSERRRHASPVSHHSK